MAKNAELKEEKKKKRKSDVADLAADDKKAKKEKRKSLAADADDKAEFDVPIEAITPIAVPLAGKKLSKKLFKTVKRASKARQLKRGVKEVVKSLRKGEKGLLLLAANITPVDVVSHLPVLAEETKGVEYAWVLSKEELGAASGTKRATSCVLVCATPQKRKDAKAPSAEDIAEWKEPLDECLDEVKKLEAVVQA
ncbi:hypothetical protein CspHIS471_0312530 [Cutaneotrichosporon sp. HIS471]|nr:hypothetical protein CspHIS471_0312530 [Cutaneotrichosporon sp. HIS471]